MKKLIIGLDIGGTKIDGVVWDGQEVVKQLTIVTPKTLFEFTHNLGKLVAFLRGKDQIVKLGVGMAGLADKSKKILSSSPNIRYIKNYSFEKFGKSLGFKTIGLDNDASCFLSAELALGEAKGNKNVIGVIMGTGLGGALYLNGKFYRGAENFGGEIGKMSVGSGQTWEQEFQKFRDKKDYVNLVKVTTKGFYILVKVFNPESFVLGGAVAENLPTKYLKQISGNLKPLLLDRQLVPNIFVNKIKHSGAIGAALLVK